MPLRHAPRLTPRSLAARRANALKSTGPRTPCGKARVSLNSLKHDRGLGCPARFRERLLRAGYAQQEALYEGLRACLTQAFGARTAHWRREVDRFAIRAWCVATGKDFFRTKLECDFDSTPKGSRVLSEDLQQGRSPSRRHRPGLTRSLRYRAEDNYRCIGVAFWIQAAALPDPGAGAADAGGLGAAVGAGSERRVGEPGAVPSVPAETPGVLRAGEIWARPERRSRLGVRALAECGAVGEGTAPAAGRGQGEQPRRGRPVRERRARPSADRR